MISQELRKAGRGWALMLAIALPVLALADEGQDAVRVGKVSRRTLDKVDFGIGHFSYNGTVYPIGNVANGIPVLDGAGKVPLSALPAFASSPVISVAGRAGVVTLTTSDVVEASNLYFSNARVITAPLTGFTAGAGTVSATDSVLSALQKHDAKITTNATAISAETSRATAAEGTLTTSVAGNTSNISTLTSGKVDKTTTVNGHALSANVSVTQSDVGLSAVTNDAQTKSAVMPNTAPTSGQLPIGSGAAYVPKTIVGDVTVDANGNTVSVFGLNVKRSPFSAVADGATDDRNPVKSALDATISPGGGDVFLPAATYAIGNSTPFNLSSYSNLRIRGAANGATVLKRISSSASMFFSSATITGAGNITFEDLTFDGNYPALSGASAEIVVGTGVNNVTFRRCRFINMRNSAISAQTPITVENCTFEDPGTAQSIGIILQQGFTGGRFFNNIFRGGLYGGIVQGDTESYRGLQIIGNRFDGMCWYLPAILSGSGSNVTYTATTLADSPVTFSLNTGRRTELNNKAGQVARVMNTRVTSAGATATYSGRTGLQDLSGNFSSVQVGDWLCASNTCGVVSAVISSTEVAVEEWVVKSTLYRTAAPANGTGYTIYNAYIGHIMSWSGNTITVYRWTDINGNAVTPTAGAPYEIAPMPNYQGIYATTNSENWQITGNYFARSNSDACALNAGFGHNLSGNTFYFNHDTSVTVQASRCSISGTRISKAGICGIAIEGNDNSLSGGTISSTDWLVGNPDGGDIVVQNLGGNTFNPTNNQISGFRLIGGGNSSSAQGILVDAHSGTGVISGTVIRNNYSTGHAIGEFYVGNPTVNPTTPGLVNTTLLSGNTGAVTNSVSDTVVLGGAITTSAVTHQWFASFDSATGAFTQTQPAFSDLSGTLAIGQAPTGLTSSTLATGDKGVTSLSLATSGLIHTTPTTFSRDGSGNWTGTMSLASQSAWTILGNGTSGSTTPTFETATGTGSPVRASSAALVDPTGVVIAKSATGIALNAANGTVYDVYTVPAGKSFILTGYGVEFTTVTGFSGNPVVKIQNSNGPLTITSNLTTNNTGIGFVNWLGVSSSNTIKVIAAGDKAQLVLVTGSASTTLLSTIWITGILH